MFTGSVFDNTLSQDGQSGKDWGGGGKGNHRGRGRARGVLDPADDSADELEDWDSGGEYEGQDEADSDPGKAYGDAGQARRFLYIKVRH